MPNDCAVLGVGLDIGVFNWGVDDKVEVYDGGVDESDDVRDDSVDVGIVSLVTDGGRLYVPTGLRPIPDTLLPSDSNTKIATFTHFFIIIFPESAI